jgi:hypothetical protein
LPVIKIYDFPHGARGLRVAWLCEEMGLAQTFVPVGFPPDGSYRELNPFGRHCQTNEARRYAARRHLASGDLRRESAPLSQGSRTSLLVDLPRDEMALLIELVVYLGMN